MSLKKKLLKKNQIIITAMAVMIAVAGYINYSDSKLKTENTQSKESSDITETADISDITEDIESLDYDLTDEIAESEDAAADTPGEAVLTGASTYAAQAKISREQIRSQNKETLLEIINNESLSQEEKQTAVDSMVTMTDQIEKEAAAESLLEAKGFESVVVNLDGETADVMVPSADLDASELAQIEDVVKRKTGVEPQNIVITPMDETIAE